jgi:transposase
MLKMSQTGEILRMSKVEGYSIRQIAKRLDVSRNTVRSILRGDRIRNGSEQGQARQSAPGPKLGPYKTKLEEMIAENEKKSPRERRNAISLYEELQGCGYGGAVDSVRRCVKQWREAHKEGTSQAYIPLWFSPGDAMQFDWSHEVACISGIDTMVKVAHMRLCHSRYCLVQAFPLERQEMMLEAIKRAFLFFGGVPRRLIVDNLKAAVIEVLIGKERKWADRFEGFCAHYLIDPRACNRGKGNEKGQVERQVGVLRENFFKPRVEAESFDELNDRLWSQCVERAKRCAHPEISAKSIHSIWEQEEKSALMSLPPNDYECCRIDEERRVDACCTVAFDSNRYSVPCEYVGKRVVVRGYAENVKIVYKGKQVAEHRRLFGRGVTAYEPLHYLAVLERKPGALENGRPFAGWRLPEIFDTALRMLRLSNGGGGDKEFVKLLLLLRDHEIADVEVALQTAVEQGIPQASCVENILRRLLDKETATQLVDDARNILELECEPSADPGLYDRHLRQGVAK